LTRALPIKPLTPRIRIFMVFSFEFRVSRDEVKPSDVLKP
jgi:hypothetical protein